MAVLMLMNTDVECVNITVIDDEGVEGDENFLLVLHTSDQAVRIEPQYAYVTIEDDDVEKGIYTHTLLQVYTLVI